MIGDDMGILKILRRHLVSQGYGVSIALDDQDAYEMAESIQPDLFVLVLDFEIFPINGFDICDKLQKMSQTPLMVISSIYCNQVRTCILDFGVADYLPVPVNTEDFLARVRSLMRHRGIFNGDSGKLVFRNLMINTVTHQVLVHDEPVYLTPKEYDLLFNLVIHSDRVISNNDLLITLWGDEYSKKKRYLRILISRLRRKIEDNPLNPKYILSNSGVGYRFVPDMC